MRYRTTNNPINRFPLYFIPVAILNISANIVSFGRIQKFLDQPEVRPVRPVTNSQTKIAIRYKQAYYLVVYLQ